MTYYTLQIIVAVSLIFSSPSRLNAQEVNIELADGNQVSAMLSISKPENPSVLLLHQCNRTQTMWTPMVAELNKKGFNTLTVDMRGYGKSTTEDFNIEKHDYENVTKHFKNDIDQINTYWRDKLPKSQYRIVLGASCGGGLASKTAVMYADIKALILISPSLREHWLSQELRNKLSKHTQLPILAIASEQDINAMRYVDEVFKENNAPETQKIVYKDRMHGEPLFTHDVNLIPYIVDWILRIN